MWEAKIPAKSKAWDHLPTLPGGPGVGKEPPSRHSRLGKQLSHGRPQRWEVVELWSLPNLLQGQCTPRPSFWSWSFRSRVAPGFPSSSSSPADKHQAEEVATRY